MSLLRTITPKMASAEIIGDCPLFHLEVNGFYCRRCCRLTYLSRREDEEQRCEHRLRKLWARVGGDYDSSDPFPKRPAGMHRGTYYRLCEEICAVEEQRDTASTLSIIHSAAQLLRRMGEC